MPRSASQEHPAQMVLQLPRLVVAAPQGRSGKTTVTLGLCAALAARGLTVQPFKKGPDYIDPSWLSEAAGRACRTLDPFFLVSPDRIRQAFSKGAAGTDLSLVEGNHGLYDSLDDEGSSSTAAVARMLQAPVILVVNAARMSRSVAALVKGYQIFEPETNIAAVILNNVAQSRHEAKLRQAIEQHCRLSVVGALPRSDQLTIPDRHLGLVPRAEDDQLIPAIAACRQAAEQYLDLEAILAIAHTAPPLLVTPPARQEAVPSITPPFQGEVAAPITPPFRGKAAPPITPPFQGGAGGGSIRIGVIRDRAFSFYYPENLEALHEAGADLVFIDALHDSGLPQIEALYIGGGFPEMFLSELSANTGLRADIRAAAEAGLPIYAECGGLMYLSRRITWGEQSAEMVGALPCEVQMTARPQGHGYVIAEATEDNLFLPPGATIRGHEFHHSQVVNLNGDQPLGYRLARGNGLGGGRDGLVYHHILASYTHLHAAGSPGWAEGLVARARIYAQRM